MPIELCAVIGKPLPSRTVCPLEVGVCMYQTSGGKCLNREDLPLVEFAEARGRSIPTQDEVAKFKAALLAALS